MYTRINTNAEKLAESFDRRSLENYLKLQPTKKFYPTKDAFSQKIEGFGAISLTKQIDYILWHFKKTYSIDWK